MSSVDMAADPFDLDRIESVAARLDLRQPNNSRFAHFPGWFHDLVPRTRVMTNVMPNPAPEYPVVGPHEQVRPIGVIMSPTMHFNIWHITERGYHI